jgi:GNAT superfamily N-acetyltransferase
MTLELRKNAPLTLDQFIDIYRRSGINRPCDERERMQRMMTHANLIITAWVDGELAGLARCFIDYGWVCYLSDLLVDAARQREGIGAALIERVREELGAQCQLVLLSAPGAMDYYPKVGFEPAGHAFFIRRQAG